MSLNEFSVDGSVNACIAFPNLVTRQYILGAMHEMSLNVYLRLMCYAQYIYYIADYGARWQ